MDTVIIDGLSFALPLFIIAIGGIDVYKRQQGEGRVPVCD